MSTRCFLSQGFVSALFGIQEKKYAACLSLAVGIQYTFAYPDYGHDVQKNVDIPDAICINLAINDSLGGKEDYFLLMSKLPIFPKLRV